MGVASGCGEQEMGVASGSGWNTIYPYSSCICSFLQQHPTASLLFVHFVKCFSFFIPTRIYYICTCIKKGMYMRTCIKVYFRLYVVP